MKLGLFETKIRPPLALGIQLWYIHPVECYSARTRNALSSHEKTRRKLKRQSAKATVLYDSNHVTFWKRYTQKAMVSRGRGGGKGRCWSTDF